MYLYLGVRGRISAQTPRDVPYGFVVGREQRCVDSLYTVISTPIYTYVARPLLGETEYPEGVDWAIVGWR